jgi:hypothetical protein
MDLWVHLELVVPLLIFGGTTSTVMAVLIYILINNVQNSPFLPYSYQHSLFFFLFYVPSAGIIGMYHNTQALLVGVLSGLILLISFLTTLLLVHRTATDLCILTFSSYY